MSTGARPAWSRFRVDVDALAIAVPLLVFGAFVLAGVTTSSIGIGAMRENPASPLGLQLGQAQAIRSDEYGTESPLWLGQLARAGESATGPLSVADALFA